ncbi:hypothetical protein HanPI659440_Chr10g0371921 [Helianthus annuus]|nr:hypothetical protein HanPI659440_Chr10g0371921 [Helianthus annuus]
MSEADIAQLIAQQLQAAIPTIITEVTAGVNTRLHNNQPNPGNPNPDNHPPQRPCSYKEFMSCKPLEFHGTEGPNGIVKWIEKMEKVINICNCLDNCVVKYATGTFQDHALTWWNIVIQTCGQEAINQMRWEELKQIMLDQFCPKNEIQKLENEF